MAPQPLRSIPSNVFQAQQSTASRPLGSSRLQTGKIASTGTSGWGYTPGLAGAPSLGNSQSRSSTMAMSSFAQTIGGGSQASLDPSEFPSLSATPQTQVPNASTQAIWGNAGAHRTQPQHSPQHPPGHQRTSQSHNTSNNSQQTIQPPPNSNHSQLHSQRQQDGDSQSHSSVFSPASSTLDDYRFGQGARAARALDHDGGVDDFPPLGGLGQTDAAQAVRIPSAAGGAFSSQSPFRSAMVSDQQARYSQGEQTQPEQNNASLAEPHNIYALSGLNDIDKFGLTGLMETLRSGTDHANLLLGMDLNQLGLELHRPETSPLYVDWAGPFADPTSRPIIPEFTLPQAYTVTNVPPLHTKIGSFSDDTLFVIFYQNPRDEAQEMAANELYQRDWRWHKKLQQWMMKAKEFGEPVVSQSRQEERGWYYFWDAHNWRRERKEFILSYEHLHHGQLPQNLPQLQ